MHFGVPLFLETPIYRFTGILNDAPNSVPFRSLANFIFLVAFKENQTFLAESCERLTVCGHVFTGQKLQWKLLDQIGANTRLAINAPQIATVELRMTIDGPSQTATVSFLNFIWLRRVHACDLIKQSQ